jgi:hypothetical protein
MLKERALGRVWAARSGAGNVADVTAQVMASAAQGIAAGTAINVDLVFEDARIALEETRRGAEGVVHGCRRARGGPVALLGPEGHAQGTSPGRTATRGPEPGWTRGPA